MKLVHEIDESSWKTMHRLVLERSDGERVEGLFSLFEDVAVLSDDQIAGAKQISGSEPQSGYMATTDYFQGTLPRIIRFESFAEFPVELRDVSILGNTFLRASDREAGDFEISELPDAENEPHGNDDTFALAP
jgi:hypothetical protein